MFEYLYVKVLSGVLNHQVLSSLFQIYAFNILISILQVGKPEPGKHI